MFRVKLILTLANQVSLDWFKKGVKFCRKMSIKDNAIFREPQNLTAFLPSGSRKYWLKILIKLFLKPVDSKKGGDADIHQDF
jgi:hypothetical protein